MSSNNPGSEPFYRPPATKGKLSGSELIYFLGLTLFIVGIILALGGLILKGLL